MGDTKDFKYEIDKDFNFVIEEGANTSICLRKISWNDRPAKIDIRKYLYKDGEERLGKGVSLSDDATNELVNVLTQNGYGDTKQILRGIKNRNDFEESLKNIDSDDPVDDDGSEEYYDPSELLG